jgi:LmbE family N-acetylglucosaminyl deacetylase
VRVVVAFDGAAGDALHDPAARSREARAGGRRLGVRDYAFLDHPEGHRPGLEELARGAAELAREVRTFAPELVYAPWAGEHHLDHHVLARAARVALCAAGFRGVALGYEVWTPLVPTRVVDVTPVFDLKLSALCAHASQLGLGDLLHSTAGIAAHRSAYLGRGGRQGEAFAPLMAGFPADPEELACLARLVRADARRDTCTSRS